MAQSGIGSFYTSHWIIFNLPPQNSISNLYPKEHFWICVVKLKFSSPKRHKSFIKTSAAACSSECRITVDETFGMRIFWPTPPPPPPLSPHPTPLPYLDSQRRMGHNLWINYGFNDTRLAAPAWLLWNRDLLFQTASSNPSDISLSPDSSTRLFPRRRNIHRID